MNTTPSSDESSESLWDKIQRLIDGDMTQESQVRFLNELDIQYPEQWRTVAMGFVEAQIIRRSLAKMRDEANDRTAQTKIRNYSASFARQILAPMAAILVVGLFIGVTVSKLDRPSQQNVAADRAASPAIYETFVAARTSDGDAFIVPISVHRSH